MNNDSSFSSSDDVRTAGPLAHLQKIEFDGPVELELGGQLPSLTCAFETWGELNASRSNAVLVCHAISGDSHAAKHGEDDVDGWWDKLIGPGRAIDTNRFFVVCPNVLGGCRGSTGPGDAMPLKSSSMDVTNSSEHENSFTASESERPYGAEFPTVTIGDMVDVQRQLQQHLKIPKWRAVVGGSLGGHQALCWATRYPENTQTCIAIASSARLTSQALAFDVVARNAIQTDPHFQQGQYYNATQSPDTGLAIARMLGHITYLSSQAMDEKFEVDRHDPREIVTAFEQKFSIGSYLAYQGQKFTSRFDANSYLTLSMAMDLFDLGATQSALEASFARTKCDFLLVSFSSDWLFSPQQSCDIVDALLALGKPVSYAEITTDAGHDAFLIDKDIQQFAPLVAAKLSDAQNRSAYGDDTDADADTSVHSSFSPESEAKAEAEGRPEPANRSCEKGEQALILDLIPPRASVLDLGCGDGSLLAALRDRNHTQLVGIEVAQRDIHAAAARGLNVIDHDLNEGLVAFRDGQFDIVVLSETLQIVANIESLLAEMLRVGKRSIVSFHNFAFRELREDYVLRGRSPKATGGYDFDWYNTPNRRFPSIYDVEDLCRVKNAEIHQAIYLDTRRQKQVPAEDDPNLNADLAILVISAAQ